MQKSEKAIEVTIMKKEHEIRYVKPNIGALHGRIGRSILETIRNTPRPDRTDLEKRADEARARLLAARKNG